MRAAAAALFVSVFAGCAHAPARQFMVAAAHPLATEAGYSVLQRGGSAVDAAIAVQMVLGLVEPESSGIGGGAFMLHWSAPERTLRSYDGRETAPAAAAAGRFLNSEKSPLPFFEAAVGGKSVGVPGVLRMLELAHQRHGTLPWPALFEPAIRLAEAGFATSPRLRLQLSGERFLREDPQARELYYGADGEPRERITNAQYGQTLRAIAAQGAEAFYRGDIARDLVRAVRARGGDLSQQDLAAYQALEREPLCGPYRRWRICSVGPPSSGGLAVLQILGLLERTPFAQAPPHSAEAVHYFSEAGRLAYADRAYYVGDPAFVDVPLARLLSAAYLDERARDIGPRSMRQALPGGTEAVGTSHFTIVDAEGSLVSMTTTIESTFGSRIMVRGFLLNNELTDFDFVPGSANQVAPGKRPRSSMAPTVVFDDTREVHAALGSPGGPNIINYVAKALVGMLDWGLDVQSAVAVPNFGSRNGPTLVESHTSYESLRGELERRNHEVETAPLTSGLHGIERVPGGWRGGADPRREGTVRGR
ncbi:MAG TPA: gamma-glutamyltransferase [Burkholderiales bacterium]|nr:gamma-glutamyltransferase [Burkholderiales bacterium]